MGAHLGAEQMDDDVAGVEKHPIAPLGALDGYRVQALVLQFFDQMIGHCRELPLIAAGGDDHGVGDAALAGEIDDDDFFRFVAIQ